MDSPLTKLIERLSEYYTDKVFVEVGAFDGVTHSFTRPLLLKDKDWVGYYVEPHPQNYLALRAHVNGLRAYTARVGIANAGKDFLPFYFGKPAQCSTFSFRATRLRPTKYTGESLEVQCRSLKELLDEWFIPHDFTLLVLDMEGSDIEAIQTLGPYLPRIIITEVWSFDPVLYTQKFALLADRGYVFLTRVGHDDVWVHKDSFCAYSQDFLISYPPCDGKPLATPLA